MAPCYVHTTRVNVGSYEKKQGAGEIGNREGGSSPPHAGKEREREGRSDLIKSAAFDYRPAVTWIVTSFLRAERDSPSRVNFALVHLLRSRCA